MDEGQNKLNGVERDMTKEESKAYDALSWYKDWSKVCPSLVWKTFGVIRATLGNASVSTGTKIECLNEAIKLIRKQCGKKPGAPLSARNPLSGNIWKLLVAIWIGWKRKGKRYGNCAWPTNCSRQQTHGGKIVNFRHCPERSLPPSRIAICSYWDQGERRRLHPLRTGAFFQDTEDTFAGHFLYADIEDHEGEGDYVNGIVTFYICPQGFAR